MTSIGEELINQLEKRDVEVVFGIPGVHTIELYRGIAKSKIRHVTPRHEQGAGFMADGYARVTGKPGVALVITGPGVTNTLTPMAQARADSVPMLVISGVNALPNLGKGFGCLHEIPDQQATVASIIEKSFTIEDPKHLSPALENVFDGFENTRPGPAHIEIPLDVAELKASSGVRLAPKLSERGISAKIISQVLERLKSAENPLIIAGGGMRNNNLDLAELANILNAPTVLTTNARGLMHGHDLVVPASPSLAAVRKLINAADVVLALGTELGKTDFDMYASGTMPNTEHMIRVDICEEQLSRHDTEIEICGDAGEFTKSLLSELQGRAHFNRSGGERAAEARAAAYDEIGEDMRALSGLLNAIRDTCPNSIIVGDSTQLIYAGNLYYDHDKPGGWFNAATGYGALGYGIPAAIGAAIGSPESRVICLCGDGGAQFSLPEMMVAVDENLPIIFVIWNNRGYQEIETSMQDANVQVVGCDPTPPKFEFVAASCDIQYLECDADPVNVQKSLTQALQLNSAALVEIKV